LNNSKVNDMNEFWPNLEVATYIFAFKFCNFSFLIHGNIT